MAAVMEYLAAEILELAGNAARDNKEVSHHPQTPPIGHQERRRTEQAVGWCDHCPGWCPAQHPGCPLAQEKCKCQGKGLICMLRSCRPDLFKQIYHGILKKKKKKNFFFKILYYNKLFIKKYLPVSQK